MDHEHFLKAIEDDPDNDFPRLVYADWLEEQGDSRGEFIRLQVQSVAENDWSGEQRYKASERAKELLETHQAKWFPEFQSFLDRASLMCERGLLTGIHLYLPQHSDLKQLENDHRIRDLEFSCNDTETVTQRPARLLLAIPRLRSLNCWGGKLSHRVVNIVAQHPSLEFLSIDLKDDVEAKDIRSILSTPNLKCLLIRFSEDRDNVEELLREFRVQRLEKWRTLPTDQKRKEAIDSLTWISFYEDLDFLTESVTVWHFSQSDLYDEHLEYLSVLDELEEFSANDTEFRGSGLRHLAHLPKLSKLEIVRGTLDTIEGLRGMIQLRYLRLSPSYNLITDEGAEVLITLTNLEELDISGANLSDVSLEYLSRLSKLERLTLLFTGSFTPAGLSYLQSLSQLKILRIWNLPYECLDSGGAETLSNLTTLIELDLQNCAISDHSLLQFATLKKLRWLEMLNNNSRGLTEAAALSLIESLPGLILLIDVYEEHSKRLILRGVGLESDWKRQQIDQFASWEMTPIWKPDFGPTVQHHGPFEKTLTEVIAAPSNEPRYSFNEVAEVRFIRSRLNEPPKSEPFGEPDKYRVSQTSCDWGTIMLEKSESVVRLTFQWEYGDWLYTFISRVEESRLSCMEPIFVRMAESMQFSSPE